MLFKAQSVLIKLTISGGLFCVHAAETATTIIIILLS